MIHPHTELNFINEEKGYGLTATQFIPKGTIIWVQDELDREFTPEQICNMHPQTKDVIINYMYRNNKGNYILCWDHTRYMNHSFKANCMTTPYNFEIATRDIFPGEELTDDYGYLNIIEPFKADNEGTPRQYVYPDDLVTFHKDWDTTLQKVFPKIVETKQPLINLISDELWKKINRIATGAEELDSIFLNYYDEFKTQVASIRYQD